MIKEFKNDYGKAVADTLTNKVYVVADFAITPDQLCDVMGEFTASVCGAVKWLENQ